MATVKELKEELQFNSELTSLLEAMRDSAVFQFRTLQKKRENFSRFTQSLKEFFQIVGLQKIPHIFTPLEKASLTGLIKPRINILCIIMVTSDEGFMGGLNLQVINSGIKQPGFDKAKLIIVGERGQLYLKEMGRKFTVFSTSGQKGIGYAERYELSLKLKNYIIQGIRDGQWGRVVIVYPKCLSFMVQKVEVMEVLPIQWTGDRGQGAEKQKLSPEPCPLNPEEEVIIESPAEGIIEYLVEELVLEKLIGIFEESKLSEFAARAIHLEKSSRELEENEKNLKLKFFHAHHEIIDMNTRELFSSQIIRKKG